MKIIIEGEVNGNLSLKKVSGSGLKEWNITDFSFKSDERYKLRIIDETGIELTGDVYYGENKLHGTGPLIKAE